MRCIKTGCVYYSIHDFLPSYATCNLTGKSYGRDCDTPCHLETELARWERQVEKLLSEKKKIYEQQPVLVPVLKA